MPMNPVFISWILGMFDGKRKGRINQLMNLAEQHLMGKGGQGTEFRNQGDIMDKLGHCLQVPSFHKFDLPFYHLRIQPFPALQGLNASSEMPA